MAKFVFVYHGGSMPETEAEQAQLMEAWSDWLGSAGDKLVDGGNPIGASKTIGSDGSVSEGGGANPVTGYSLVAADSLNDAVAFAKASPHLGSGGSIEIGEAVEM